MIRARTLTAAVVLSALILGPLAPVSFDFGASPAFAKGNGGGKGGGNGGSSGGKGGSGKSKGGSGSSKAEGNAKGGSRAKVGGNIARAAAAATMTAAATDVVEPVDPVSVKHGKIASELKGLNAYHASESAFASASPNSQVGRIAAYRDAALETIAAGEAAEAAATALSEATAALTESQGALAALEEGYTGRTTAQIDADIAALDPASADYQSRLDALNAERLAAETHEAERMALEEEIAANEAAVTDAETAVVDAETALADAAAAEGDALTTAANGRMLSDPAIDFLREQLGL